METFQVQDQPLDLRVGFTPYWAHYPRFEVTQPVHVPAAGPSPQWTPACRPDLQPSETPSPTLHSPQDYLPLAYAPANELRPGPSGAIEDDAYLSDDPEYQMFKSDALHVVAEKNGGSLLSHNPRMRRAVQSRQDADESYRSRRERNNLAAKQSRDRRKLREMDSALKVSFLNKKLAEVSALLAAGVCGACRRRRDARA